ncbi:MAG: hypothetical protein K2Q26_10520 [Bdellovibrionales bacterium]|nr:hypothetical protein [Bdellovibrionales bacterium]
MKLKKTSIVISVFFLLLILAALAHRQSRAMLKFALWHYGLIPTPDVAQAFHQSDDALLYITSKSPMRENLDHLLVAFEKIKKESDNLVALQKQIDEIYTKLEIDNPSPLSGSETLIDKIYSDEFKQSANDQAISFSLGLGLQPDGLAQINLLNFQIKKDLGKVIFAFGTLGASQPIELPLLGYLFANPTSYLKRAIEESPRLTAAQKRILQEEINKTQIEKIYISGVPSFKLTHLDYQNLSMHLTVIGRKSLLWSTSSEILAKMVDHLSKPLEVPPESLDTNYILSAYLNFENLFNVVPGVYKMIAGPLLSALKTVRVKAALTDTIEIDVDSKFTDESVAQEAASAYSEFIEKMRTAPGSATDKIYSVAQENAKVSQDRTSAIIRIALPLDSLRDSLSDFIKQQVTILNTDYTHLNHFLQYKIANQLNQLTLTSNEVDPQTDNFDTESAEEEVELEKIKSREHLSLQYPRKFVASPDEEQKKVQPVMILAHVSCPEETQAQIKLKGIEAEDFASFSKLGDKSKAITRSIISTRADDGPRSYAISGAHPTTQVNLFAETQRDFPSPLLGDKSAPGSMASLMKHFAHCSLKHDPEILVQTVN